MVYISLKKFKKCVKFFNLFMLITVVLLFSFNNSYSASVIKIVNNSTKQEWVLPNDVPVLGSQNEYLLVDNNINRLFGTSGPEPEFLAEHIENGITGNDFSKTGWTNFYTNKAKYTEADKYSGKKSILFNFNGTQTGCAIMYDYGKRIKEAYISAWIKLDKRDDQTRFQWKNWRLKSTSDYNVTASGSAAIIGDTWWGATPGVWGNSDVQVYSNGVGLQDQKRSLVPDAFLFNKWQRIEAYYKKTNYFKSKTLGMFEWRRVGRESGEVIVSNNNALTHDDSLADSIDSWWRYLMIGHYYGNLSGGSFVDMRIYYDDIYISQSRARIEIGNASTWDSCTYREIQKVVNWPRALNERTITIKVNKGGSFTTGSAYLYYVDHNGIPTNLGKIILE